MMMIKFFLVWSTFCATAVSVSLKSTPLKLKSDTAVSKESPDIKVAAQWSQKLSGSQGFDAFPWALRWTARSMIGSMDSTAGLNFVSTRGFEDRAGPRILEVVLVGFFVCILLTMLFAAVVFSGKNFTDDLGAVSKDLPSPTKVPLSKHMYQGQNEHLNEELLERAWCAEAIARTRMNKIMAEAARRQQPKALEPRRPCGSSSSEEDGLSASEDRSAHGSEEVPFALLMGEAPPKQPLQPPFALLMGGQALEPARDGPILPAEVPDVAAQKNTISARKLRHPNDKRPKTPTGRKSTRQASC